MPGKESNAIELSKHDHREVESMFKQFDAENESAANPRSPSTSASA